MRNKLLFAVLLVVVVASTAVMVNAVKPDTPGGIIQEILDKIEALADMINNVEYTLQEQIDDLSGQISELLIFKSTVPDQIDDLQEQIDNIELTPGPEGPPGLSGYEIVYNETYVDLEAYDPDDYTYDYAWGVAYCPSGKRVIGGGLDDRLWMHLDLTSSYPVSRTDDETKETIYGWKVWVKNDFSWGRSGPIYPFAICAYVEE